MPNLTAIAEATRRSEALWIGAPGGQLRLVWHIWHDDALYLVGGGDEQPLPPLADRAVVVVRSRARPTDRALQWDADVSVVEPDTSAYDEVAPLLAASRLNATAQDLPARWAATGAQLLRLIPSRRPAPGSSPSPPARPTR